VTVIRLIEVLQRIVWIDLLNNFALFTLGQSLSFCKVLRTAGNFGLRGGIGRAYAQPHGGCAADAYNGQTDQKRASGKASFSAVGVFNIGCFVLESNAHRGPPKFIIGRTVAPQTTEPMVNSSYQWGDCTASLARRPCRRVALVTGVLSAVRHKDRKELGAVNAVWSRVVRQP
jgi:hypothetical protein